MRTVAALVSDPPLPQKANGHENYVHEVTNMIMIIIRN